MSHRKVTAILQYEVLEKVETALQAIGIPGISVTVVKGYGNYANFFQSPPMVTHARIEIFTDESQVDSVVRTIMQTAHTGVEGDGIIAVLPVEHIYRIRDKAEIER